MKRNTSRGTLSPKGRTARHINLHYERLVYLLADGNYTHGIYKNVSNSICSKFTYSLPICDFLTPYPLLLRIHKSYVVNVSFVEKVRFSSDRLSFEIVMKTGHILSVARRRADDVKKHLEQYPHITWPNKRSI